MTEKQRLALLREAEKELKLTGQGYIQWKKGGMQGGHWKTAMAALNRLERDLLPNPVPALGPLWIPGKSILLHDLTHATTGLPKDSRGVSLWPALDDAFNQGTVILAVENMVVIDPPTGSHPGEAFYARGRSKIRFWYAHLDRTHPIGTKFRKGDAVGRVAANTIGGGPHVHLAINVELLLGVGRQLLHHTDYSHGAPLVGRQLRAALAA